MTRYASGRRQEWRVRKMLESAGAYIVVRSAGSKGAADLIALFDHDTFAIQVKNHKPSQKDHDAVTEASRHTSARWALVHLNGSEMRVWSYKNGRPHKVSVPGLGAGAVGGGERAGGEL